jgi:hypothetical protein
MMSDEQAERRKCPAHCEDSRESNKEAITEVKEAIPKIWTALNKKVSYIVFFALLTIFIGLISGSIGYIFSRQNDNFKEHNLLVKTTEMDKMETRLIGNQVESEKRVITAINEIKGNVRK